MLAKGPTSALPSSKPKSSEKQGWLYVRTLAGRPARTVWIRRWFYVKNGIFGCLVQGSKSGGVEESERIGVLLCGIRPSAQEERRFCFEVKTKDTTIVLQAESQPEMVEWMGTFDLAKQRALSDPQSTDTFSNPDSEVIDPAFAISMPTAPEFTASAADVGMLGNTEEGLERTSTLNIPTSTDTMASLHRSSFDVTANRRSPALDRESESSRDRLMQKLDTYRKTSSGISGSGAMAGSGIASLISATHASMPVGPGTISSQPAEQPAAKVAAIPNRTAFLARTLAPNSLAPSTLVNPPNATNLSSTAVSVSGERGIGVGSADRTGGMPSGILANLWGSANWGAVNRFERGEVKSATHASAPQAPAAQSQRQSTVDSTESMPQPAVGATVGSSPRPHRKTISLDGDTAELQRTLIPTSTPNEFPPQYPIQLKHQDAQFRLLFPDVDPGEKLVLVIRATWVPNEHQEFPGRAYLTPKHIFFYSTHLGLVLVTGFSLDRITEVSATPGKDCDFLFLHLKGAHDERDFARITIKTFLGDLRLLQRRIDFILQNYADGETQNLESIMKRLVELENEPEPGSPSSESWDGFSSMDSFKRHPSLRTSRDLRTKILVDQGLSTELQRQANRSGSFKFKLPSRPVSYVPRGFEHPVMERVYNVSPKALFHLLFGDRSAVWQLAYLEQGARKLKSGPWTASEQGTLRREFEYEITATGLPGLRRQVSVTDSQLVDVMNDHLLYVVTDRKTPWHLPSSSSYKLVSKVVIAHETKSRSKLAVYAGIEWQRQPWLTSRLVGRHALADLRSDAAYVGQIVAAQVEKLGPHSNTKKAVQIFGPVGQQAQVLEFPNPDAGTQRLVHPRRRWTTVAMLFTAVSNVVANFIASVVALGLSTGRAAWRAVDANRMLVVVLAASVLVNLALSSREAWAWRQQYNARWYMGRLGVGKDLVMHKTVRLGDIDAAVTSAGLADLGDGACLRGFRAVCDASASTAPPAVVHLQRSRQRLGRYRHDLMVAMRIVNRVESELVRAGWEDFVLGETERCNGMALVLARQANDTLADDVRARLDEYCASCRAAELDFEA